MKRNSISQLVLLSTLIGFLAGAQSFNSVLAQRSGQTRFGVEEPIRRPVRIPAPILRMLRRDEQVQQCFQNDENRGSDIRSWFVASAMNLNDDRQPDLIVKLSDNAPLCLIGANVGPFWVFSNTGQIGEGYELVLSESGLGLTILNAKSNGYRNIEMGAAAGAAFLSVSIYRFDGQVYQRRECTRTNLRTKKTVRIPCP